MNLRRWLAGTAAGAAALLLGAAHAAALNLVANGNFDDVDQVDGWTETAVWSAADWQDDPSSGSLVNTAPGGADNALSRYCATVTPGEQIHVRARVRVAPGQAAGQVTLRLVFWTAGCGTSSPVGGAVASDPVAETGNWEFVTLGALDVPATAQGADIQFTVAKTTANGSLTAHLDHVFLPEPEGAFGDAAMLSSLASLMRVSRGRRRRAACPGAACGGASSRPPAPPRPCDRHSGA